MNSNNEIMRFIFFLHEQHIFFLMKKYRTSSGDYMFVYHYFSNLILLIRSPSNKTRKYIYNQGNGKMRLVF